ncbi:TonB-linked outer membrane protein, SusC/RagA family [Flavobacterium glycines]|jgi:TonB-linked SusC/RagA family outer membrane protein|uniref:SusC/RagA family TonB-linked outer membrane protein n=1 Tax=Flavobacterium glycines TaxID=551990 RepID=A0A1B9DRJ4_9FLAO|nr:TonB-dependent receptor [Flavobacterium glycines]OCB72298.1 SusC/RagA family TonB-linked outer membrane protein [Flavobacterium glycines]GEL09766.1 SusC/RagA family TonB-linked outer membrane protein [Flavobacterium glycines]SDI94532.1 TonB-linked outer membrane protein, SusC/RagA family [Flavobacterium glycines]
MKRKIILYLILMGSFFSLSAQNIGIKGTVTSSEDGMSLPGVSVVVSGTNKGTTTDLDGKYELKNVDAKATLIFSYVGFTNQTVPVNGQETINVALKAESQQLTEVVVTGYSKERKVDVTGSVVVVEMRPIAGQSMSSGNAMQAMQGRVAGLSVEKSGDPSGASSKILIRGVSTLGNTDPLYVIDGIPTVRPEVFASLNPSVIESVQVLKDASASSIYGSRAANGVIVVTTKNAFKGEKMNVTYNTSVSSMSEKKQRYKMLNAVDRGKILWQASVNDGALPEDGYGEIYNFDWNHNLANPVLNSVTVQPYVGGNTNVPAGDTNWQDVMYKRGFLTNNDLSVSGGSDKSNAILNLGYLNNTGMLKYTDYERYTARLNANFKLFNDKVRFGINSQFTQSNETLASTDVGSAPTPALAVSLVPTIPVYTSTGDFAGPLGSGYSDRNNPLLMQYLNRWDNTRRMSLFANVFTEIDLVKNLTFRNSIGMDFNDYKKKDIEPTVNNGFVTRANNSLSLDTNKYSSLTISNTLNYNVKLSDHKIGVMIGTESVKTDFNSIYARAEGFAVEKESYFVLASASGARTSNGLSTGSRLLSQFGKVNYSFSDKYLATFTIRRDGSSRFGADNRYGIFPAATVGWKINNEDFLKNIEVISLLKLRAGYGEVGNQSIGDNARFGLYEARYGPNQNVFDPWFFNIYYNVGTAYDLNGTNTGNLPSGFVSIQAANSGLKWESTKEINVGLDFAFLQNKLSGSFDYFSRKTDGILIKPPVASVVGEGQQRSVNGASTENKGWELILGYSDTLENGLNFNVTTNFGATKNKITQLPEEVRSAYPGTAANSIVGHSQFEIFGYKTEGLFQSQADIDSHATQVASRLGGIKYVDINNDGVINSNDRTFIGSTQPKLEYGINISLAYKNIDMSIFGSGVTGRKGVDPYIYWNNFVQGRENVGPGTLNAWTPTNTNTSIPSLTTNNTDYANMSDYLLRNNSYFKVRNIQIGYTLPESITDKTGFITHCRIYAQGENLFWFTPKGYIGSDPERTDINRIPVPTTLSLGVNFNF